MSETLDLTPEGFKEAQDKARAEGFTVITPAQDELLLDLDSPEQEVVYYRALNILSEELRARETSRWLSKSGNVHVVVKLGRKLPPVLRIALEVSLGSDPIRGLLSILRKLNGVPEPSILFKPLVPRDNLSKEAGDS